MRPIEKPAPIHIAQMPGSTFALPDLEVPDDLPYSKWEDHMQRQILAANGFSDDAGFRKATESDVDALREAAYCVLSSGAQSSDEPLFRRGLSDRDPSARLWAARALARLGDSSVRTLFEREIESAPASGHYAPLLAARFLGDLGEPTAFAAIDRAMTDFSERHVVVMNAMPFARLNGRQYAPGKSIDIWSLYSRALAGDDQTQNVALAQMAELHDRAALPLLESFIARSASSPLRHKAEALRDQLR